MITISQEIPNFYPAYNESYIKFSTDFSENSKANINVGAYTFTIYPSPNGSYMFNLKHIVTALINDNKFRDNISFVNIGGVSDPSLYLSLTVEITAFSNSGSETITKDYTFTKAVKQAGDVNYSNPNQLLLPTPDGSNYHLKYFEGFPLDFGFRYVNSGDVITVTNKSTEQVATFNVTQTGSHRLIIDNASENWNNDNILAMPDLLNPLQIRVNGTLRNTLNLNKQPLKEGVYLKWFNSEGGYSYWLFNKFYKTDYSTDEIDRISTNNFTDIYSQKQGTTVISGKALDKSQTLKTQVNEIEFEHLKSIVSSPLVQMWTRQDPYSVGEWIDVKVISRGLSNNTKRYIKKVEVEIELPEQNSQFI